MAWHYNTLSEHKLRAGRVFKSNVYQCKYNSYSDIIKSVSATLCTALSLKALYTVCGYGFDLDGRYI